MFFLAVNSFATPLLRVEGDMVLFLCFSSTVPSTMVSLILGYLVWDEREHPVLFCKIFTWIRFQPRGVRKCSPSLLDSNSEDIENTTLSESFRIIRKLYIVHSTNHRFRITTIWVVTRYFAANLLGVFVEVDDYGSSSRARERGSSLLV